MSHAFATIAFTQSVKAAQQRYGSRAQYARTLEQPGDTTNDRLGDAEAAFIGSQRSFYMASVSETGWPYVQHRGGPAGFLRVLDEKTLAFSDFAGNRQLVSAGNLSVNDRVALILVDYARRVRLKLLGRLRQEAFLDDPTLQGYRARPERSFVITVEAFDWNCPQHIPVRFDAEDVEKAIAARDARIAELEARIAGTV